MKKGIFNNLPSAEYFAAKRLNNSGIKQLLRSPMHYKNSLEAPRLETKALTIGSAVHCAILEPNRFDVDYTFAPENLDKRTKAGKAAWDELESSEKTVLSFNDYTDVLSISHAVKEHPTAKKLIKNGHAEVTIFSEIDDVLTKSRMDYYLPNANVIIDLKTTDDASPSAFARSVASYGYDIQAAWYIDNAQALDIYIETFVFIVVEKTSPHAVALYELDPASIEVGRSKYQHALHLYKHCLATGEWPGYSENIQTLSLPAWAMREAA